MMDESLKGLMYISRSSYSIDLQSGSHGKVNNPVISQNVQWRSHPWNRNLNTMLFDRQFLLRLRVCYIKIEHEISTYLSNNTDFRINWWHGLNLSDESSVICNGAMNSMILMYTQSKFKTYQVEYNGLIIPIALRKWTRNNYPI